MLVFNTKTNQIGRFNGTLTFLPHYLQPYADMSHRQRAIVINHFVPVSKHVACYLNESTTNRIREFQDTFQAMVKSSEEPDFNLLNALLVGVEWEYWFRMH